ncbi:MAG: BLUF domain-containing protein [Parvularculaceae bacterium]
MLETIVYTSAAWSERPEEAGLDAILAASRRNNARAGLTGVLLFAKGSFIQALEGPPAALAETYGRILKDRRHRLVIELYRAPIAGRNFGDWSMGYRAADMGPLAGAFDLTAKAIADIDRRKHGHDIFRLLASFYRTHHRDDLAS